MNKDLTCNQVSALINFYIEGKLNPRLKKYVDLHLEKCQNCRKKIQDFGLYNMKDVDDYYAFMSANKGAKQDPVALGKLSSLLKPIIERYNDLNSDEDRFSARMAMRNFVKSYAYITQLTRIHDEELFKEYVFANNLLPLLPVGKIVIENFFVCKG